MNHHILIVDNSPILVNLLKAHLLDEGFEVSCADDYNGLASCLDAHRPDLILFDLTPPHVSGWEMCIHLCQRSGAPILYVTGPDLPGRWTSQPRYEDTLVGALPKPFTFDSLLQCINSLLAAACGIVAA